MSTGSPRGSFGASGAEIEKQVREGREAELLESQAKEVAKERVEDRKSKRDEKIDAKLPKQVQCVAGVVSYDEFKQLYKSIWEQIEEKDHLLTGRITFDTKIGKTEIRLQSLKRREEQALTAYEPTPIGFKDTSPQDRAAQQIGFQSRRMVIQIVNLGEATFPDFKLTPETRSDWESDEAVIQAMDYLLDMDPTLFEHLVTLIGDMDQAKYFALVENMKNPLALGSPTTES